MAANLESNNQDDDFEHDVQIDTTEDNELEQYGIWVKVGPEDVEQTDPDGEFGLESLSGDEIDGDALLTEEEEKLLGNLEDSSTGLAAPDDVLSSDDITDVLSPDDLSAGEDELGGELPGDELGELSDISLDDFQEESSEELIDEDEAGIGISVDDELGNLSDLELEDDIPEIGLDGDLIDLDSDLKIPEIADEANSFESEVAEEILPGADDGLNNIELDDLDEGNGEEDLVELELETEFDTQVTDVEGTTGDDSEDFGSDLGLDSLDAALDAPDDALVDIDEAPDMTEDAVDDVASLEMALREEDPSPLENAPSGSPDLEKIENDLASIKEELNALRNELSLLKQAPQLTEETNADSMGFFVEEEDETISLTGDELDNILNTADITEETVEETEVPDDQEIIDFPVETPGTDIEEPAVDFSPAEELLLDTPEPEEHPEPLDIEPLDSLEPIEGLPDLEPDIELVLPSGGPDTELLVDKDDIIPLDGENDVDLDDLDIAEPQVDVADQTESISLDETDELLGEILPAEDDLLGSDAIFDTEPTDLDLEPIDLDDDDLEPAIEADDLDIEELTLEDHEEDGGVEIVLDEPGEQDFALEEILDDEIEEPELEELEIDIDGGMEEFSEPEELEDIEVEAEVEALAEEPVDTEEEVDLLELEDLDAEESSMDDIPVLVAEPAAEAAVSPVESAETAIPDGLKDELRSVLSYMDHLLESLPEEKIQEFAQSEHFETYKKLFEELGLEL